MSERVIKFRAWDTKDKKLLLPEHQRFVMIPTLPGFGADVHYEDSRCHFDEGFFDWASADLIGGRYILEQFTGLKDKNDKDIYEGDVVDWGAWDDGDGERGCIEYRLENAGFIVNHFSKHGGEGFDRLDYFMQKRTSDYVECSECGTSKEITTPLQVEVVGNVHENSELLGKIIK